jgi:hypothetical protein
MSLRPNRATARGERHLIAVCVAYPGAMLWSPTYLESRLPRPLPTKDRGILYAVKDVRAYVLSLPDSRSEHLHWQRAHQLLLDQAHVVTLRRQVELALFCDAQLDLAAIRHDRPPAPSFGDELAPVSTGHPA